MRVEALPHVHLDGERLSARDQPPARHQHRSHEAERKNRADVEPELLPVVGRERAVDDVLRDPDEGDLGSLGADREHDRDDQRDLVRAQEAEQPSERLAIAGRLLHLRNLAVTPLAHACAEAETVRRETAGDELRAERRGHRSPTRWWATGPSTWSGFPARSRTSSSSGRTSEQASFFRRLASFSRLILFDKRGTGLSDRVAGIADLETRMDDVRAVMDAAGSATAAAIRRLRRRADEHPLRGHLPGALPGARLYGTLPRFTRAPGFPAGMTRAEDASATTRRTSGSGARVELARSVARQRRGRGARTRHFALCMRHEREPGAAVALEPDEPGDRRARRAALDPCAHPRPQPGGRPGFLRSTARATWRSTSRARGSVELPGGTHMVFAGDRERVAEEIERFDARVCTGRSRSLIRTACLPRSSSRTSSARPRAGRARRPRLAGAAGGAPRRVRQQLARYRGSSWTRPATGSSPASTGRPGRSAAPGDHGGGRDIGLEVRAGLHSGECELLDGKVAGIAVAIGAASQRRPRSGRSSSRRRSRTSWRAQASPSRTGAPPSSRACRASGAYSPSRASSSARISARGARRRARGWRGRSASCSRRTGAGAGSRSRRRARSGGRRTRSRSSGRAGGGPQGPPTGTISRGRISSSSHSRQNAQSSCSRGVGVRSPRPLGALAGIAARDRRAVEGRVELVLVELEPAAERPAGAAAPRQTLLSFLRLPAPGRRCTRAGRGTAGRSAATRAGSRPRHRRGRRGCPAAARRASGSSSACASRADGDEPAAGEEDLAAAELLRRARPA